MERLDDQPGWRPRRHASRNESGGLACSPRGARHSQGSVEKAEKYLFYRGVGNLPSPITATRTLDNDGLIIREEVPRHLGLRGHFQFAPCGSCMSAKMGLSHFVRWEAQLTGESGRELARSTVDFAAAQNRKTSQRRQDENRSGGPKR